MACQSEQSCCWLMNKSSYLVHANCHILPGSARWVGEVLRRTGACPNLLPSCTSWVEGYRLGVFHSKIRNRPQVQLHESSGTTWQPHLPRCKPCSHLVVESA